MSTNELASHNHTVVFALSGKHNHGIVTGNNTDAPYSMISTQARVTNTTRYTNTDGVHAHDISMNTTGSNNKHENRPPYETVQRWKRTS